MLISKDFISNLKLPPFIRANSAFQKHDQYDKIFPYIGLENFESPIRDIRPSAKFIAKHSFFGMRSNINTDIDNSVLKKIGWGIVGTPLLFCDLLLDAVHALNLKRSEKDSNVKLVFSAAGNEGAWDIATMSMRGINSCQSWNARRAIQLVGSIIDPCCGIMYLTDGTEMTLGTEMLYRTLVRYVVHSTLGPCLFMEQIYPYTTSDATKRALNMLFATALYERTKMPVVYDFCLINDFTLGELFIPDSTATSDNYYYASYRDSNLPYRKILPEHLKVFPSLHLFKEKFLN